MAALESFDKVDTSAVAELTRINKERNILQERLAKVEERRETVSAEVFERVRRDYEAQITALEEQALDPKDEARAGFVKLNELYDEVQSALEAASLDKEELELRNEIGEFDRREFEKRMSERRKLLEERQAEIAAGDKLKAKFVGAFPSEDDLLAGPASRREAAAPAEPTGELEEGATDKIPLVPDGATVLLHRGVLDADSVGTAVAPRPSARPADASEAGEPTAPPEGATVLLPRKGIEALKLAGRVAASSAAAEQESAPSDAAPAGTPGGATMIVRRAKLVVASGERADKELPLSLEGNLLGSSSDCNVVVEGEAVSARYDLMYYLEARLSGGGTLWPDWRKQQPYVVVSTVAEK